MTSQAQTKNHHVIHAKKGKRGGKRQLRGPGKPRRQSLWGGQKKTPAFISRGGSRNGVIVGGCRVKQESVGKGYGIRSRLQGEAFPATLKTKWPEKELARTKDPPTRKPGKKEFGDRGGGCREHQQMGDNRLESGLANQANLEGNHSYVPPTPHPPKKKNRGGINNFATGEQRDGRLRGQKRRPGDGAQGKRQLCSWGVTEEKNEGSAGGNVSDQEGGMNREEAMEDRKDRISLKKNKRRKRENHESQKEDNVKREIKLRKRKVYKTLIIPKNRPCGVSRNTLLDRTGTVPPERFPGAGKSVPASKEKNTEIAADVQTTSGGDEHHRMAEGDKLIAKEVWGNGPGCRPA